MSFMFQFVAVMTS